MKTVASILGLCVFAAVITADDGAELARLQQRITRLDAGVRSAEAIRAIKHLQYAYGHYAEVGLWHDLADLFAEKGVGHYPSGDLGKEGIRKLFLQDIGKGRVGLPEGQLYPHIMLQPVVTVATDGKTAEGRWRVLAMLGSYGGAATWAGGIYENKYVLENGVWKIADLHYYSRYRGRYDQPAWTADKEAIPIHYSPVRAGTPVPDGAVPSVPAEIAGPASLSARIEDLKARAERLIDEDAVQNLQYIYAYYVDRKMWRDVADLFADDATMELDQRGVYVGKAHIRRALNQFGPEGLRQGELNDHIQLQTIVHIEPDGRSAKARGVELIMSGSHGGSGQWGEGIFENQYVKRSGVWKIRSLHYFPMLITDYDKGWGKDAKPAPGPGKDFPPDRPPTEVYEIFPKFHIPPFHFANPVTGLPAQYPVGAAAAGIAKNSRLFGDQPSKRAAAGHTIAQLDGRITEAERLFQMAVAHDAAENLASAYGYYLDESMWDETADLFSRDARRRLSSIGSDTGREQIRQSFKARYAAAKPKDSFTTHQLVQPVIHVATDGQSTQMRVRLFQLGASGGNGYWIAGIYETKTAIEDGVWKFKTMDLDYIWAADYRSGWARVDVNSSIRKLVAAPFPGIVDLPFHYRNPVTGRKPPVFVP